MLKALRGKVIVRPNEQDKQYVKETPSGLAIVGSYNEELGLRRGEVISVGAGVRDIKEGDEACYLAFSGHPLKVDDVKYLVMMPDDIVGITANV